MTRRATLRASDADREQVAERLRHAAAEGRLLTEELEDRLGAALSAKTYAELDAIVADLPTGEVGHRSRSGTPARLPSPAAAVFALLVAVALISTVAFGAGGHAHVDHHWGAGPTSGMPVIWLVVVAAGWRYIAHRRHGHRSDPPRS